MRGVDISNLQGHPDTYRHLDWYIQSEFVIVQAIEPPPGYPGYPFLDPETGKRGYTGVALRQAQRDGKKVGVYAWLWNGLADTRSNILSRLATVPLSVTLDMRPFVDTEDTTGGPAGIVASPLAERVLRQLRCEERPVLHTLAGITVASRRSDVLDARAAADEWAAQRVLPPSGGYSAPWYEDGYLNGWWPDGWVEWRAGYGVPPGSLIGGRVVAHQYTSTPVDQNVMLESEIVSGGGPVDDAERKAMQDKIDGLVSSLGLVCGDYLKPLTRASAAKYVQTFVGQARAIAEQQGINHA